MKIKIMGVEIDGTEIFIILILGLTEYMKIKNKSLDEIKEEITKGR